MYQPSVGGGMGRATRRILAALVSLITLLAVLATAPPPAEAGVVDLPTPPEPGCIDTVAGGVGLHEGVQTPAGGIVLDVPGPIIMVVVEWIGRDDANSGVSDLELEVTGPGGTVSRHRPGQPGQHRPGERERHRDDLRLVGRHHRPGRRRRGRGVHLRHRAVRQLPRPGPVVGRRGDRRVRHAARATRRSARSSGRSAPTSSSGAPPTPRPPPTSSCGTGPSLWPRKPRSPCERHSAEPTPRR